MSGQTFRERQDTITPHWQLLAGTSAKIHTHQATVTRVELGAQYVLNEVDGTTTGVRLRVAYDNTRPVVQVMLVAQDGTTLGSCSTCTSVPCVHHNALLEAGAHLPGEAGKLVRNVLLDANTAYDLPDNDPLPPLFTDDDGVLVFQSDTTRWIPPVPPLPPVTLRFRHDLPHRWPDELAGHIPATADLRDAITNPAAQARIETFSALTRTVFLLLGAPGTGKSATLAHLAATRGVPYLPVNSPEQVELFRVGLADGATVLQHSPLVAAIQYPCVIELVDLHRWTDRLDVLDAIEPLLNPTATRLTAHYPVAGGAIDVPIHPGLVIAATSNRPTVDFGEKWLERWTVLPFTQPDHDTVQHDLVTTGHRWLSALSAAGCTQACTDELLGRFVITVIEAIDILNRDPMLAARHTWGTRAAREAIQLRLLGVEPNEIAAAVFAGKLPRDPALALHALALVHTISGWGRPKVSALPFANLLTDEQVQAAFAELGGDVE